MSKEILNIIPVDIVSFLLVVLFSLIIGLEQRRLHIKEDFESLFGTDRTFTLIGILGFILYIIEPKHLLPFLGGGVIIAILLAIYYSERIKLHKQFGITSLVTALITYCLAPLIYTQSDWLVLLVVVTVLVLTEIKMTLFEFSKKFDDGEFITLAKFLVIAGVILPLLPHRPIAAWLNISPYQSWLAIVAVSGISYFSYLLKKFVFPRSGIILTGILGGLYSSTATTIILARKSKELPGEAKIPSAIMLAAAMMYLRIFLLALFFNQAIALRLAPAFAVLILISVGIALYFSRAHNASKVVHVDAAITPRTNPLEFKTAFVFGILFIFFAFFTAYVKSNYGTGGLNILSFVVGITDIDPFILNLFQTQWDVAESFLVMAVVNAATSNNLLKMIYGLVLGDKYIRRGLIVGFSTLIVAGLVISFIFL